MNFVITHRWCTRPQAAPLVEEYLEDHDPVWVALQRFNAASEGEFTVPLDPEPLTLLLSDLSIVFQRLPGWLGGLAHGDSEAELTFASQGTELKLIAKRSKDRITLSARSIAPDRPLPARYGPVTVPASSFVKGWVDFIVALLDALVVTDPALENDPSYRRYRSAIEAAASAV